MPKENHPSWPRCEECKQPLYRDMTNRGPVKRCRNPQCPVDEVIEG